MKAHIPFGIIPLTKCAYKIRPVFNMNTLVNYGFFERMVLRITARWRRQSLSDGNLCCLLKGIRLGVVRKAVRPGSTFGHSVVVVLIDLLSETDVDPISIIRRTERISGEDSFGVARKGGWPTLSCSGIPRP
jgi:hypothetical protein